MDELPTLDKLIIRRPDLYKNWKCPRCNRVEETLHHLWECSTSIGIFKEIILEYINNIKRLTLRVISRKNMYLQKDFEINIIKYFHKISDIYKLIENKIPRTLIKKIYILVNSKEKIYTILHQAFNKMYIDLKEKIWILKCKIMIEKK